MAHVAQVFVWLAIILLPILLFYDRLAKRIPSRLHPIQKPQSPLGLVPVSGLGVSPFSEGVDIVFVHGLGSNPDTTWKAKGGTELAGKAPAVESIQRDICWVSEFLADDIPPEHKKRIRVYFFNYDSYWKRDAIQAQLNHFGKDLLARLNTEVRQTDEERCRSLVFVAHSYGGLVVKEALVQASGRPDPNNIVDSAKAVLFLGTPHRGSRFSTWGSKIAQLLQPLGSNPLLLFELAYDSPFLLRMHNDFVERCSESLQVFNFYEQRGTNVFNLWFWHWRPLCVEESSATYSSHGVRNLPLPVDHSGLNKFSTRDGSYQAIARNLLKVADSCLHQKCLQRHSMPYKSVDTYTERNKESLEIANKLDMPCDKGGLLGSVVIHGFAGVGKTQLALRYVESHGNLYNTILWLDAENEPKTISSFERCANDLGLSLNQGSTRLNGLVDSPAVQAVLRWLKQRNAEEHAWLVVLDNVNDFDFGIKTVIPAGPYGRVIITSCDSKATMLVDGGSESVQVSVLEQHQSRAILFNHLKWDAVTVSNAKLQNCDDVAEKLGHFALAVDLAGAYISNESNKDATLREYPKIFDQHQDDLLQNNAFQGLRPHDKTVWTVWDTTLERLKNKYSSRPDLVLAFLAHFRGKVVQEELFRLVHSAINEVEQGLDDFPQLPDWLNKLIKQKGEKDEKWDPFNYRQTVNILHRYGLLDIADIGWKGISMHSLIRWRAIRYEQNAPWESWYLIFIVAACKQLRREYDKPHIRRYLVTHLPTMNLMGKGNVEYILDQIGSVLYDEGRWNEAEKMCLQVMETTKRVLGEEHPNTLTSKANLAATYANQGRWNEAEGIVVQVMETRKRVLGEEHPDTLTSKANLAATYGNQGRWNEAEGIEVQVMETRKQVLGDEHPHTLTSKANLAATYRNQGRWNEAEKMCLQVMETRKRVLGEEHPDTLTSKANLAATYGKQGRWNEAEGIEVQVMETRKRVLGEEHPNTLTSKANLAATYWNQGRWNEAEKMEVQVMETRKRVLGDEHPHTLASKANLAVTYMNQGRWNEAEEMEVQVMETRKRVLGEEHPHTLTSKANLAVTYMNQERWNEAEGIEVQVMETRKRVLGEEHPHTLASKANLAVTYMNQERWNEAEGIEVQVMETRKWVLGEEHPDTLASKANLAATYMNQGRWNEAEGIEVQVIETRKRVLGEEHPDTLTSIANLAVTYRNQGRWNEAEGIEVQVMETRKRVLGEEHPDTLASIANLAAIYHASGQCEIAVSLLRDVVPIQEKKLGTNHPDTVSSKAALQQWLNNGGNN